MISVSVPGFCHYRSQGPQNLCQPQTLAPTHWPEREALSTAFLQIPTSSRASLLNHAVSGGRRWLQKP